MAKMKPHHILLQLGYTTAQRLQGISRFAKEHGWHITLEDRSALPRGWTGDGALVTIRQNAAPLVAYARKLRDGGIPVVDFSIAHPEIRLPRVIGDHAAIGALAADHFADRNFRNAVFFSMDYSHVHALRYGGFCRGLRRRVPRWIWREHVAPSRFDDWKRFIAWLSRLLQDAPKPLAVFAYNDADASRVLNACLQTGLSVPEEVAVLGVDDDPLICENQFVPLTSIRHDLERIGYEGAALLQRLMDGAKPPKAPIAIPPLGLVVRTSTDTLAADSPLLRHALFYFREHLSDSFGMTQLAEALGASETEIRQAFAEGLDTTPMKELRHRRLARAKQLLSDTDLTVGEVARQTGFCNIAHFSNAFTAAVGHSPLAYRSHIR